MPRTINRKNTARSTFSKILINNKFYSDSKAWEENDNKLSSSRCFFHVLFLFFFLAYFFSF